jgi:hypothetical protein
MAETELKKQKLEYVAIGALILIALLIGLNRFKKTESDDEVFSRKEFNEKWRDVALLEKEVPEGEEIIIYDVDIERVPFKSPFEDKKTAGEESEKITLPAMTFQGMVWNSKRPQVIIDNKVYDAGDTIMKEDGVLVESIEKDGIHLRFKGREFIVRPK